MNMNENVDERLVAAVMDDTQSDIDIARIAVEKIRQGAESIAAGMHGRSNVTAAFEHHDGTPMSPEEVLAHQCAHAASIGKSLGQDFCKKPHQLYWNNFPPWLGTVTSLTAGQCSLACCTGS